MDLSLYDSTTFDRGRSRFVWALWLGISSLLFETWLPGSGWRRALLKLFGAKIGHGVVIKPRVRVKFPWRLEVGNNSWIGEDTWIDNPVMVKLDANVCVSQGVYICAGGHDATVEDFPWTAQPITIADQAWVGAFARVGPGVNVGQGGQIALGAVVTRDVDPWTLVVGNPGRAIGKRQEKRRAEQTAAG